MTDSEPFFQRRNINESFPKAFLIKAIGVTIQKNAMLMMSIEIYFPNSSDMPNQSLPQTLNTAGKVMATSRNARDAKKKISSL